MPNYSDSTQSKTLSREVLESSLTALTSSITKLGGSTQTNSWYGENNTHRGDDEGISNRNPSNQPPNSRRRYTKVSYRRYNSKQDNVGNSPNNKSYEWTTSGRPICAKCGLVGHMHRDCRRHGNFSENRKDSFQNRNQ